VVKALVVVGSALVLALSCGCSLLLDSGGLGPAGDDAGIDPSRPLVECGDPMPALAASPGIPLHGPGLSVDGLRLVALDRTNNTLVVMERSGPFELFGAPEDAELESVNDPDFVDIGGVVMFAAAPGPGRDLLRCPVGDMCTALDIYGPGGTPLSPHLLSEHVLDLDGPSVAVSPSQEVRMAFNLAPYDQSSRAVFVASPRSSALEAWDAVPVEALTNASPDDPTLSPRGELLLTAADDKTKAYALRWDDDQQAYVEPLELAAASLNALEIGAVSGNRFELFGASLSNEILRLDCTASMDLE
jgi:hypothetical protein